MYATSIVPHSAFHDMSGSLPLPSAVCVPVVQLPLSKRKHYTYMHFPPLHKKKVSMPTV